MQDLQLNQFSILQQISDDLRQIFEQVSGKSLFNQWVFKKGHPELDINISLLDTNMLKIQVVQLQEEILLYFLWSPIVHDNHEYWSQYSKILADGNRMAFRNLKSRLPRKILRKVSRKFLNDYAIRLWRKWEKELVCESTTITVSDEIAENLRAMDNNLSPNRIFVVPNFPLRTEVKNFEKPQYHSSSCVYAGLSGRVQTTPASYEY